MTFQSKKRGISRKKGIKELILTNLEQLICIYQRDFSDSFRFVFVSKENRIFVHNNGLSINNIKTEKL